MKINLKVHSKEISEKIINCFEKGGKILIFGCGGLAAEASHFAGEMVVQYKRKGRRPLPAIALTVDPAILTAISNDFGFTYIFTRQIEALGKPEDVVIGMSTSGKSLSINHGLKTAKKMGLGTIDWPRFEGKDTAEIQDEQIKLMHMVCDRVDEYFAS